jgi:hypothetical protein
MAQTIETPVSRQYCKPTDCLSLYGEGDNNETLEKQKCRR